MLRLDDRCRVARVVASRPSKFTLRRFGVSGRVSVGKADGPPGPFADASGPRARCARAGGASGAHASSVWKARKASQAHRRQGSGVAAGAATRVQSERPSGPLRSRSGAPGSLRSHGWGCGASAAAKRFGARGPGLASLAPVAPLRRVPTAQWLSRKAPPSEASAAAKCSGARGPWRPLRGVASRPRLAALARAALGRREVSARHRRCRTALAASSQVSE